MSVLQYPGVLGAAALAGIDHERTLLQGHAGQAAGDDLHLIGDEMADILFVLCCLANQTGIDLDAALVQNLEKKTQRDATRHHDNPKLQS